MQPFIYATSIDNDKYLRNTRMYLADRRRKQPGGDRRPCSALVKVCSASHIEQLVKNALPGAPLTYVASPPSAIPIKLNYQYFSMGQSAWRGRR